MLPIIAGAITGGAALLQNVINSFATRRANRKAEELYNEQLRYMTPQQQMQRFKSAGLNPRLIYQNVNTAPISRPEVSKNSIDLSGIAQAVKAYQDTKEGNVNIEVAQNTREKGLIDLGAINPFNTGNNFKSPYEKLQDANISQAESKAITAKSEADSSQKYYEGRASETEKNAAIREIESKYIDANLQQKQEFQKEKIEYQKQINKIAESNAKQAQFMQLWLDRYEITDRDNPTIQLLKQYVVHKYHKKLSQITPMVWDAIVKMF